MVSQICHKCNISVPGGNLARHQRRYHSQGSMRTCSQCHKTIHAKGWFQHNKSHRLENPSTEIPRASLPSPRTSLPPRPSTPSPDSLWNSFLAITDISMLPLLDTYKEEIQRAGGLSQLQSRKSPLWDSIGLHPPLLFPADECWVKKPSVEEYMSDLIINSNENTAIFGRGNPRQPLGSSHIYDVFQQLRQPNITSALCALNMDAGLPNVKIPERFHGKSAIFESSYDVKTNITPKFSGVDLHVDCGAHGITLLHSGCVKLWALYPLTEKNCDLWAKRYNSNAMFIELQGQLEGGEFCVQTEDQAIYLPPGCIHSTITLEGGLTPGIMFTTAECLRPSALIWDLDSGIKRDRDDCVYFLRSVEIIMHTKNQTQYPKAMFEMCSRFKKIAALKPNNWAHFKRCLPPVCSHCEKKWADHK
ncbi:hypothetical protein F4802DRAFT_591120 [Xylaria palmicola]|nr:hypothetical protein F4802DRAFT_591120 [Xylaria palmicola]